MIKDLLVFRETWLYSFIPYAILPHRLVCKLSDLGLPNSICLWIKESPAFYTAHTQLCPHIQEQHIFAGDTTVVVLNSGRDEPAYRHGVEWLTWSTDNNLLLNITKTNEIVLDFRKVRRLRLKNDCVLVQIVMNIVGYLTQTQCFDA